MRRRILSLMLAAAMVLVMQTAAYASGIYGGGGFSDASKRYGFDDTLAVIVYNGEVSWQDYDEIYAGSSVYIPIVMLNETTVNNGGSDDDDDDNGSGNGTRTVDVMVQATEKNIKDDKLTLSYKATRGQRYVQGVSIVDGKKEKINGLEAGAYAKIRLADAFNSTGHANIEVKLVLAINKISYQETEVTLECSMINRTVIISSDSVYGAQLPTMFEADYDYTGEATFDMGNGVSYTGRVRARQKYVLDYSTAENEDIQSQYPDATLDFHNFNGDNDTFASFGRLEIPNPFPVRGETSAYVYSISGNTLVKVGEASVSGNTLTIRTQTLQNYVIADRELFALTEYEPPSTAAGVQPSPTAPTSGGAPTAPPATTAPTTATGTTPAYTGVAAGNYSTDNPLTGVSVPILLPVGIAVPSGVYAAWLFATRRKRKG